MTLKVSLIEGRRLTPPPGLHVADPKVIFNLGDQKYEAPAKHGTLNPTWKGEVDFEFKVTDPMRQELKVEVFDSASNNARMGKYALRLDRLIRDQYQELRVPLLHRDQRSNRWMPYPAGSTIILQVHPMGFGENSEMRRSLERDRLRDSSRKGRSVSPGPMDRSITPISYPNGRDATPAPQRNLAVGSHDRSASPAPPGRSATPLGSSPAEPSTSDAPLLEVVIKEAIGLPGPKGNMAVRMAIGGNKQITNPKHLERPAATEEDGANGLGDVEWDELFTFSVDPSSTSELRLDVGPATRLPPATNGVQLTSGKYTLRLDKLVANRTSEWWLPLMYRDPSSSSNRWIESASGAKLHLFVTARGFGLPDDARRNSLDMDPESARVRAAALAGKGGCICVRVIEATQLSFKGYTVDGVTGWKPPVAVLNLGQSKAHATADSWDQSGTASWSQVVCIPSASSLDALPDLRISLDCKPPAGNSVTLGKHSLRLERLPQNRPTDWWVDLLSRSPDGQWGPIGKLHLEIVPIGLAGGTQETEPEPQFVEPEPIKTVEPPPRQPSPPQHRPTSPPPAPRKVDPGVLASYDFGRSAKGAPASREYHHFVHGSSHFWRVKPSDVLLLPAIETDPTRFGCRISNSNDPSKYLVVRSFTVVNHFGLYRDIGTEDDRIENHYPGYDGVVGRDWVDIFRVEQSLQELQAAEDRRKAEAEHALWVAEQERQAAERALSEVYMRDASNVFGQNVALNKSQLDTERQNAAAKLAARAESREREQRSVEQDLKAFEADLSNDITRQLRESELELERQLTEARQDAAAAQLKVREASEIALGAGRTTDVKLPPVDDSITRRMEQAKLRMQKQHQVDEANRAIHKVQTQAAQPSPGVPKKIKKGVIPADLSPLQAIYASVCQERGQVPSKPVMLSLPAEASDLTGLSLKDNYVGPAGIEALLELFYLCPNCVALDLSQCFITPDVIGLLCQKAASHPSIESIVLSGNFISGDSAQELLKLIRKNSNIMVLNLEGCRINGYLQKKLEAQLMRNMKIRAANKLGKTMSPADYSAADVGAAEALPPIAP